MPIRMPITAAITAIVNSGILGEGLGLGLGLGEGDGGTLAHLQLTKFPLQLTTLRGAPTVFNK